MKKNIKIGCVFCFLVVAGLVLIYVIPLSPSSWFVNCDASYDLIRVEGKRMWNFLEHESRQAGFTRWPSDDNSSTDNSNSTDYFNNMMSGLDNDQRKNLFRSIQWRFEINAMSNLIFTPQNNYWIIIKNMPADAPSNIIVLATRNIAPKSLRTCMNEYDMTKKIRFSEDNYDDALKNWGVLIRKDGKVVIIPRNLVKTRRKSYGFIYNEPFDITTNLVNGLQVKYLTPTGEVTPTNE